MILPTASTATAALANDDNRPWVSNWIARLYRSDLGTPLLSADFVAGQGTAVRLIDVRDPQEFIGALGYIPGADWIPIERVDSLPERLGLNTPTILISGNGDRSAEVARRLEQKGMRFVAALAGGVARWLSHGYSTTRDPSILDRCDVLRPLGQPAHPSADDGGLTIEAVERHIGDPLSVRWIKLAALVLHAQLSCIDGRDDRGIIGSPGGDAGQFLLALAAIETTLGRTLDAEAISTLLLRRIDALGGFYMHTDHGAMETVAASMRSDPRLEAAMADYCSNDRGWRQFLRRPPLVLRDAVLEHLCQPSTIGCGHIRLMLQHSDDYRIRPGLVVDYLRAFFRARWEGAFRAEYESLHGRHDERAVLITRVEGSLLPFTPVPLVSPANAQGQMFVYHPQVSNYLRGLLVDFLLQQTDLIPDLGNDARAQLLEQIDALDGVHTENSLAHLAMGLPIYEVIFNGSDQVRVEASGIVGAGSTGNG